MRLKAGSKVAKTRSQRTVIRTERVNLARAVAPAEVIALESADDPEGSSFWLGEPRAHRPQEKPRMDALWSRAGTEFSTTSPSATTSAFRLLLLLLFFFFLPRL